MVDVKFIDLPGSWQHFSIPVDELDGGHVRGRPRLRRLEHPRLPEDQRERHAADAGPDDGLHRSGLPRARRSASICNVADPLTREPYTRDPRYVAQKAEAYLKKTGIATTATSGPRPSSSSSTTSASTRTRTSATTTSTPTRASGTRGTQNGKPNLGYRPRYKEGYFPVPPIDKLQDLRSEMVLTMSESGIDVEVHHHEVGTAGQAEIDMRFDTLTKMADDLLLYKYIVKNVAYQNGYTATFMPKPLFGDNGSGMHSHQSLWKGGTNLFFDEKGYAGLSDIGPPLHRRPAEARAGAAGLLRADDQLATAGWCPATRRRSTWCTRSATARPRSASRCTRPARRRSASSSAARTRPPTRTSPSPRC